MADDAPVLNQINLVVKDMAATTAFYRRLGLVIEDTVPEWERHHRTAAMPDGLDLDFDSTEFAPRWNGGWSGGSGVLGFRVPTRQAVDRLHAELTGAGYRSQQEPYDAFWGARYAVVEDPDGNAVGLMSPVDQERRTDEPPPPPRGS